MSKEIKQIITNARKENRTFLLEPESKTIMKEIGIATPDFRIATNEKEAKKFANELGYPIVMKIISPQIVHKTDAGGVRLNINSTNEAKKTFNEIIKTVKKYDSSAQIKGILIEKMKPSTTEIIIGITRDTTFGPAVMFGLGGIFVELFKDVSFRIAPLTEKDAHEMIREIKGLPLLQGFRGAPNVDLSLIVRLLVKISKFAMEYIDDIKEIDLNPIFAYEKELQVVDARIILMK
ncbi:MAG: acetate--CoA ligase family protein [Asgard group archaeon]|nr:acetate--CoA ligase family protein [Asgard group archaeon]